MLALLRDAAADATDVPLTLRLRRPNGTVAAEAVPQPDPAGGRFWSVPLSPGAAQGAWTIEAFADPTAAPIGRTTITVADFVPERLAVEIGPAPGPLVAGTPLALPVAARFLYGPAAAGLAARGELVIAPDPEPFPHLAEWRFGLVEDVPDQIREELALAETDAQGRTTAAILLPRAPDTTRPLRATVTVEVNEPGGRPARARTSLPLRTQPVLIGIRPRFAAGAVAEGEEAAFDIGAFDGEGRAMARQGLRLRLVRERPEWRVVLRDRLARYETVWRDEPLEATAVSVGADQPVRISRRLDWGRYRLEVADPASLAATSVRFRVGFVSVAGGGETPDLLDVAADRAAYAHGDTARVRIEAPFAGTASILVLTDRVWSLRTLAVPRGATTVAIPIDRAWGPGAYAAVMLVRGRAEAGAGPMRALGLAWLGLDPAPRRLPVAIEAPDLLRPRSTIELAVRTAPDARVVLAVVDEGILRLTGHAAPDPAAWFAAKRRLGLDIRDDYGRLILPAEGEPGILRQGGDEDDGGAALPALPFVIASAVDGPRTAGPDGVARFRVEVPDVNTALRLAAVAWESARTGAAALAVPVRDRLVAEAALPRFLAPGDEARISVALHNVELPAGTVRVALSGDGPVAIEGGAQSVSLASGERARTLFGLRGTGVGVAALRLSVEGPDGYATTRVFPLTVRPARPVETTVARRELAPGASLDLAADSLARFLPGTSRASVTVNAAAPIDAAALSRALEVWPYACLEQVVSQGLPFVFFGEESPLAADRRVRLEAIVRSVFEKQRFDGAFGLWGSGDEAEPWLTAYAVEFLARARAAGVAVPEAPFEAALRWLATFTDEPADEPWRRAAQAHALHSLALAGRPRPGAARVLADQGAGRLPTPLGRGLLGAALVRMGDRGRGEALLREAVGRPAAGAVPAGFRLHRARRGDADRPGTRDRDGRRTEFRPCLIACRPISLLPARTSTQEQAWLLAAAAVLGRDGTPVALAIDGRERAPALLTTVLRAPSELPLSLRNLGQRPIIASVALSGVPAQAPGAGRDGLAVRRNFLNRNGTPLNLDALRQNDVFILVIEGRAETRLPHQALLVHGLPAGWEAEPARLGPGEVPAFPFLGELSRARSIALRDDRLVAQLDLTAEEPSFKLAFLVRAVTAGRFELPGALLFDMYKPRFFARQATGRIAVAPAD
ncbi:MAG: alpha-2-macroglobulin family protein [Acetobacteraceae bacterium]|nr:alpha-2-macroglobulin family protein [Acetobacteraceae bacterium]